MGILVAYLKNKKARVMAMGNTQNSLTLLVALSKMLSEKVSKERRIGINEAEEFVIECISDGMKIMKE